MFFATSGRPEMFRAALESLVKTTQGYDLEVVTVIDDDKMAYIHAAGFGVNIIDYSHTKRGALWAWNRGLQLSSGDILVPAGDDQLFHPDWLTIALEAHRTHCKGYGVVGMNDLAYDGNKQVATMWLFDRRWCKEMMGGVFAPPVYKYFCVDMEWNEKAKKHGAFYWEEKSIVEHLHSAHNKRPVDATDALKEDMWMEIDNVVFESRKAQGFPVTWESLI